MKKKLAPLPVIPVHADTRVTHYARPLVTWTRPGFSAWFNALARQDGPLDLQSDAFGAYGVP